MEAFTGTTEAVAAVAAAAAAHIFMSCLFGFFLLNITFLDSDTVHKTNTNMKNIAGLHFSLQSRLTFCVEIQVYCMGEVIEQSKGVTRELVEQHCNRGC